jgi:hypothetical protein
MSRTIIVGLAVIVVAALSFLVIGTFSEGDVDDMSSDPTPVEIEEEAVAADPVPSAINDPQEDVQDEAKNNDPNPLEQQVENAEANLEGQPLEEPVMSDTAEPAVVEGAALPDDMDAAPALPDAEVGPVDEALLGIESEAAGTGETVVITEETAEALAETDDAQGEAIQRSDTGGTAVPETETLREGFVEGETTQSVTDAELATDAIDAAASDDAAAEEALEGVDPAAVPANDEELAALLTPETFDPDAITAYVLQSDALDQVAKDALVVALQQANEQPAFVDAAILSIRRRFDIPAPQAAE